MEKEEKVCVLIIAIVQTGSQLAPTGSLAPKIGECHTPHPRGRGRGRGRGLEVEVED